LATHRSAELETLVVRVGFEERKWLLEDAPETYYLTDYDRSHPAVLVRLSRIDQDALHDLLSVSWRLTLAKARKLSRTRQQGESTSIEEGAQQIAASTWYTTPCRLGPCVSPRKRRRH
jgi:hypothetical protein